jgi:hypothetical protein
LSKMNDHFRQRTAAALFLIIVTSPLFVSAQTDFTPRERDIQKTLDNMEAELQSISDVSQNAMRNVQTAGSAPLTNSGASRQSFSQKEQNASSGSSYSKQSLRDKNMETALRNVAIEVSLEYFINAGKQTFKVIDETSGGKISELNFPLKGGMAVVKGEVRFLPRISLGGRYANSELRRGTCTDEDWDFWAEHNSEIKYIDYQITRQASKARAEFYDFNLYYNVFNFSDDAQDQLRLFPATERPGQDFGLDGASLDLFAGYQYYKSRCRMMDPLYSYERFVEGSWWEVAGLPDDVGLDSFYKIEYKGPRIGFRTTASKGKVTTGLRFALALLQSKAYGWWNLREYSFWQSGKNGIGAEMGFDVSYALTRSFSAGLGFNYLGYFQEKMKESGDQPGYSYKDLDIIRGANSENYGPTFILKYIW